MSKSTEKIEAQFPGVRCVIADQNYAAPKAHWLLDDWKKMWLEVIKDLPYAAKHDCDDFAFDYKISIQKAHAASEFPDDGFAVGVCFYLVGGNPTLGHAINWALTEDEGLIFIEPQTGDRIELTAAEKASIFFIYG